MRKRNERGPRTKARYVICLADRGLVYRSRTYKTERGASRAARRMRKRYKPLGYEVTIEVTEEIV